MEDSDFLRPARGIVYGIFGGTVLWIIIIGLIVKFH